MRWCLWNMCMCVNRLFFYFNLLIIVRGYSPLCCFCFSNYFFFNCFYFIFSTSSVSLWTFSTRFSNWLIGNFIVFFFSFLSLTEMHIMFNHQHIVICNLNLIKSFNLCGEDQKQCTGKIRNAIMLYISSLSFLFDVFFRLQLNDFELLS